MGEAHAHSGGERRIEQRAGEGDAWQLACVKGDGGQVIGGIGAVVVCPKQEVVVRSVFQGKAELVGSVFLRALILGSGCGAARFACTGGEYRDILYNEEAAGIKDIMEMYADSENERIAVGNWLVGFSAVKGRLSEQEENCVQKEVDDVTKGLYDWRIERGNNGLSR